MHRIFSGSFCIHRRLHLLLALACLVFSTSCLFSASPPEGGVGAPTMLSYSQNPVIYTQGVAIATNIPSNSGGAITSYSVEPTLPLGLNLDKNTGVISGTPTSTSEATSYAITGQNSAGSTSVQVSISVVAPCSVTQRESELDSALASANSEVDFSFSVERADGRRYTYNRGTSTLQSSYESASSSKLITAVIILRLVDQGYLKLSDRPQDRIGSWPIGSADPLYNMTLTQLLSFTSGLTQEPLCLNLAGASFENCVNNIANANAGYGIVPGQQFYYSGTHLQVAGLMAVKARGVNSWQDVFSEFKNQTGLFSNSSYDLPSSTNPRLAGGMHWNGDDYLAFLKAFIKTGTLLSPTLQAQVLSDQTADVSIVNSPTKIPIPGGLGEDWHYGFGLWHECQSSVYNCIPGTRMSSPGAYGAYPYWDREKGYFGMVARQGSLGTYANGVNIERSVRSKVEAWVSCH